jgi:hypothetical protein
MVKLKSTVSPILVGVLLAASNASLHAANSGTSSDETPDPLLELTPSERRYVDENAKALMNLKIKEDPKSKTIDGVTGYGMSFIHGAPWYPIRQNGRLSTAESFLRDTYCAADALISVKALESKSHLSTDESIIFTKTKVKIIDMIKAPPAESLGALVSLIEPGGTVRQGNDTLRILNANNPQFVPGNEYFMAVQKKQWDDGESYSYAPLSGLVRVSDGKIYTQGGNWYGFRNGASYDEVVETIKQAIRLSPCN